MLIFVLGANSRVYVQLGIVSYGSLECANGIPGVYTRVSGYIDWIRGRLRP